MAKANDMKAIFDPWIIGKVAKLYIMYLEKFGLIIIAKLETLLLQVLQKLSYNSKQLLDDDEDYFYG